MPTFVESDQHAAAILTLCAAVGLPSCQLLLVESVQEWATTHGLREQNPNRTGMTLRGQPGNVPFIVLKTSISDADRDAVIGGLEFRGFGDRRARIETPTNFLTHLVLHEAARLLDDTRDEGACDRWAFDHMAEGLVLTSEV